MDDQLLAQVQRTFWDGDRLRQMPARRAKRLVVLDQLAQRFEPGYTYTEAEVNDALRPAHPDVAMLRRCLVDEAFLGRDHGVYWRVGGSVDV